MKRNTKLIILMLIATLSNSYAQSDAPIKDKSSTTGDIDNEITNARMRAESGSKSPFSFSTSFGYSGGSIVEPFDTDRPNIYGNPEEQTETSLDGSISARYRYTKNDSLSLGAGFSLLDPWDHSVVDISNPYLGYSRVYKIGAFQTITSVDYTLGTSDYFEAYDISQVLDVSQYMMANIKGTGVTLGFSVAFGQYFYGSDQEDGIAPKSAQTNYTLGFYPQLEYVINDRYSLRTVFGYFNFKNYREDKAFKLTRAYEYQSIGVGISISRDVYIYPNIQFLADDLNEDKTNVGISATINLL